MSDVLKVLQVFIASPNDLIEERLAVKDVADGINAVFGKEVSLQIEMLGWEDRLPGCGRPQAQINNDVDKADLFLGFLWRRWGSETGDPKYTSGFEEEFSRALARYEKTGLPQICLFFKAVDKESLAGPGDQLKKVLDFKKAIIDSKKVLFRDFNLVSDWKDQTRALLERHLLKFFRRMASERDQGQSQPPPASPKDDLGNSAVANKIETKSSAASEQIVSIWTQALDAIKKGALSEFGKNKSLDNFKFARLGLAAVSMTNREIEAEMPGVHLLNILYKHHSEVHLTSLEWVLVLKANLTSHSQNRPGWFWLRKAKFKLSMLLPYLAIHDESLSVRKAALEYAREIRLPLHRRNRDKERAIDALCSHPDDETRKAALEYLARKGTKNDLPLVEQMRADSDKGVRSQAALTQLTIHFREDAAKYFDTSILTRARISEESLPVIRENAAKLSTDQLKKALAHPEQGLQALAALELVVRSAITVEEIKALGYGDTQQKVYLQYFRNAIAAGQKFPVMEIRDAMTSILFGIGIRDISDAEVNSVIAELFKLYSVEELVVLVDSDSKDASIAYRVLAENHFGIFGDRVRTDLKDDFSTRKDILKPTVAQSSGLGLLLATSLFGTAEPDVADFEAAALSGLAIHGKKDDRELILPFLQSKADLVRIAAIECLARLGKPADSETALQIAESSYGEVSNQAAGAALRLSPGVEGSILSLLKSPKPEMLKLGLLALSNAEAKKVWAQLKERLYDDNELIRKMVCAFAVKTFDAKQLAKLLDAYISRDSYFYNVVFYLDRAAYSKRPLRSLFIKEIEAFLE